MFILASGSPRRMELMEKLHIPFKVEVSGNEEIIPEGIEPEKLPEYLAIEKAKDVFKKHEGEGAVVIGSDTIVLSDAGSHSFTDTCEVEFYPLKDEEIERYVDSGEPMDKAGAYGIQGDGALLVKGIRGDYYTVMGLPVARLYRVLSELKMI